MKHLRGQNSDFYQLCNPRHTDGLSFTLLSLFTAICRQKVSIPSAISHWSEVAQPRHSYAQADLPVRSCAISAPLLPITTEAAMLIFQNLIIILHSFYCSVLVGNNLHSSMTNSTSIKLSLSAQDNTT